MNTKTLTIQSLKTLEDNHGIPYAILQIKRGDEYHDKRFERFDRTVKKYGTVNLEDYDCERTPAYASLRGGGFLLQREQHRFSKELRRLTLSPQA